MYEVTLRRETYERIHLLARAWKVDPGGAVDRLLSEFQGSARETDQHARAKTVVGIHANYGGMRIDATFDRPTRQVIMQTGPLAGQSFRSPSGAAVALVRKLKPDIRPERNGWNFWVVSQTGEALRTIR